MNKQLILMICFMTSISVLSAHPHMQILASITFEFDNDKIVGMWEEWEFDAYFTADMTMSFDTDEDGLFDKNETDEVYNNAFISLKDYNYFTFIRVGEQRITPNSVENFSLYIADNGALVYRFYVPLTEINSRDFYLSIYDFTYFCACFYQETKPVYFSEFEGLSPIYDIGKNEEYPIFFDPYAGPNDTTVHKEWKKGLNKIVIEEIHVIY